MAGPVSFRLQNRDGAWQKPYSHPKSLAGGVVEVANIQGQSLLTQLQPVLGRYRGSALALWGEPGVGKSHAARELLGALHCDSTSVKASLPLQQLVRQLPRPAGLPAWSVSSLERLAAGEELGPAGTLTAFGNLFARLAPFVLHVEDLHEAAPDRLELLRRMAQHVSGLPGVAMLVTSRQDPGTPFASSQLLPLSAAESDHLLCERAGASLPPDALAWVFSRAAGNPLFTLEYWRHLTRHGWLYSDGQSWRWREPAAGYLPTTVEALLGQLLAGAREDPACRQLLDACAYLPPEADPELLQVTSGLEPTRFAAASRDLAGQGIMLGSAFTHPLFREVARSQLDAEARKSLARRALTALRELPVQAARFVADAGLEDPESLQLLLEAAGASRDPLQAARLRAEAVRFLAGAERNRLALEAARVLANSDREQAIRLLEGVVSADPQATGAAYLLAAYHAEQGNKEEADKVQLGLEDGETALWEQRIGLRFARGDYRGIRELWELAPAGATPEPQTAYYISFALMVDGAYGRAEQLATAALSDDLPHLRRSHLLSVLGLCSYYRHDAEAGRLLDAALAAARQSDEPLFVATCLYNRSMYLEASNRVQAMHADVREALQIYRQVGSSRHYASTLVKLARIEHELGNHERAEEGLLEARSILGVGEPSVYLVSCDVELSALYLDWDAPYGTVLALKHAQAAEEASRGMNARKQGQALCQLSLVQARLGRFGQALTSAERAGTLLEPFSATPEYQVLAALASAQQGLGRPDLAEGLLRQAITLAFEHDWHVYGHKLGLQLDRLLGDTESARQRLAWFRQHGLGNGERLALRLFSELAPARQPDPPGGSTRLEFLGSPRLVVDGVAHALQGGKRRALLGLLLEARIAGRSEVSRVSLLDSLYPADDELKAGTRLKALVHNLRKGFQPGLIRTTADGYALGDCSSDAEEFLQGGPAALWRGQYLTDADSTGLVRDSLYLELAGRAEAALATDPAEAIRLSGLLLEADPYSRDHLRLRLQALAAGGGGHLERFYEAARDEMAEVGEVLPASWREFLADTSQG